MSAEDVGQFSEGPNIDAILNSHKQEQMKSAYTYEMIRFLGEGSFGECYKYAIHKADLKADGNHDGICVAKIINFQKYKGNKKQYDQEVAIMNYICEHVPKLNRMVKKIGNWEKGVEETQQSLQKIGVIIIEYCTNGDMVSFQERIIKNGFKLSHREILYLAKSGLLALEQFHHHNFIHRDIKLSNMLLDEHFNLKLCDFGLAVKLSTAEQELTDYVGTPEFMAPEIDGIQSYNKLADVYSLGCAIHKLLFGHYLAKNVKYSKTNKPYEEEKNATYALLLDLLLQMLQWHQKDRKSATAILKMITQLDEEKIKQSLSKKRYPHHITIKRVFHIRNIGYCLLLSNSQTFVYLNKDQKPLEITWPVLKLVKKHLVRQEQIRVSQTTCLDQKQKKQLKIILIFARQCPDYFNIVKGNEKQQNYDETYQCDEDKKDKDKKKEEKEKDKNKKNKKEKKEEVNIDDKKMEEEEQVERDVYYRVRITNIMVNINKYTAIIIKLSNSVVQGFFSEEQQKNQKEKQKEKQKEPNMKFKIYINFNYSRWPEHRQKIMMGLTEDRSETKTTELNNFTQAQNHPATKKYVKYIQQVMSVEYDRQLAVSSNQ